MANASVGPKLGAASARRFSHKTWLKIWGGDQLTLVGTNYTGLTFTKSAGVWSSQGTSLANQTLTFTEATGTLVIVPEPAANALAAIGAAVAAWKARRISRRRAPPGLRFGC